MGRRRYNWVVRALEMNWADHWLKAARVHEVQTASQLWDKIMEGRQPKSNKAYMKLPSKRVGSKPLIIDYPIMDEWTQRIQNILEDLPETQKTAVFWRYCGCYWDLNTWPEWAKAASITEDALKGRLKRAHKTVRLILDPTTLIKYPP